jgi:hypothetical protein
MKFNSQICTTREQSERLLALGLKKETADMVIRPDNTLIVINENSFIYHNLEKAIQEGYSPAWSLHRLMCLCPTEINRHRYVFYVSHDYVHYHDMLTGYDDDELVGFFKDNPFDSLIDCIEWLIKKGYFNKEYLEE